MQNKEPQPENLDPSDEELREMLDARELEKELARKQLSRNLSKILCIPAAVLIGVILCFPGSRKMIGSVSHDNPDPAAAKAVLAARQTPAASGIPEDLKPFSIKPGNDDNHNGDIHFAMELLQFMQTPAPQSKPSVSPGASEARKTP